MSFSDSIEINFQFSYIRYITPEVFFYLSRKNFHKKDFHCEFLREVTKIATFFQQNYYRVFFFVWGEAGGGVVTKKELIWLISTVFCHVKIFRIFLWLFFHAHSLLFSRMGF